jgi:hypothetical protein
MIKQTLQFLALPLLLFLVLPALVQAQFTFTTNSGMITITGYTGTGDMFIPEKIDDLLVTSIGDSAFLGSDLTSASIPNSVAHIGISAFAGCYNMTAIMVGESNSAFASVEGVLFNKNETTLIQFPGGKVGSYTIPHGVTTLEDRAFSDCYNLTSIEIPSSVLIIGNEAFQRCDGLMDITVDAPNPAYCRWLAFCLMPAKLRLFNTPLAGRALTSFPTA